MRASLQFAIEEIESTEELTSSRRPSRRGLYHIARKAKASLLAERFGLSVDELVANVAGVGRNIVQNEALTPEECARDFIEMSQEFGNAKAVSTSGRHTLSGRAAELRSIDAALSAAREWYARSLAASLDLRRIARNHFRCTSRLTTEITPKGMLDIDPAHPLHHAIVEL